MKISLSSFSFGCRVNEAEKIAFTNKLVASGWVYDEINPDVIIINSCAVTGKAEREVRQYIYQTRKKFPNSRIIVTGCAATLWKSLKSNIAGVDLIIPNNQKPALADILIHFPPSYYHKNKQMKENVKETGNAFSDKFLRSGRLMVKIQDGCNQYCSYCIVPFTRGLPHSRHINDIISDITTEKYEIKEVILTAINTAMFGVDTNETLIELIDEVMKKTDIPKISFGSIHPWSLTNEFIKYYQSILHLERLVPFFHVPLQSGSDTVLLRMNRQYKAQDILNKLIEIKKITPHAFIGTDIIVGFPGETKKEFEETYKLLASSPIDKFHIFRYSTRPGTLAQKVEKEWGVVSEEEKRIRAKKLSEL